MRDFHFSEQAAWDYPLVKGFALCAWGTENNPWCAVERVSPGYISQEQSFSPSAPARGRG